MARGPLTFLVLGALAATIFVGCAAGSGNSSQPSAERQAPETSKFSKAEGTGSSGRTSGGRLGHPALGSADAPVVMTEYSDYQ